MNDEMGPGELRRVLVETRDDVKALCGQTRELTVSVVELRERFIAQAAAQASRTAARDQRCASHEGELAGHDTRLRVVEIANTSTTAATAEGQRTWGSWVQTVATVAAVVGSGWAIVRGN